MWHICRKYRIFYIISYLVSFKFFKPKNVPIYQLDAFRHWRKQEKLTSFVPSNLYESQTMGYARVTEFISPTFKRDIMGQMLGQYVQPQFSDPII